MRQQAARAVRKGREAILDGVFGEGAAREAAAHWGYGADTRFSLLCISENATYRVHDPRTGGHAVLRLNRPGYHCRAALESELAWTAALRRETIVRTPQALPTLSGDRVAPLSFAAARGEAARHAAMFTFVAGSHPEPASPAGGLPAIGELAARLHAHAQTWIPPAGFTRFSWDLAAALGTEDQPGRWGDWRAGAPPSHRPVLTAAASRVSAALTAYGYARRRFGLIHADLRAANLLLAPGESAVTVIDFDDCGLSWYAYDLAASVSFLEHRPGLAEMVARLLVGYRRVCRFDAADVAALPSLVMLRRLQLLAWAASHPETDMVRSLGADFAAETAAVAERYLAGELLAGVS